MLEDEISELKNMFSGKENSAQNKNVRVAKYSIQWIFQCVVRDMKMMIIYITWM